MYEFLMQSFVKLLVIVNPFAVVPIFVSLTQHESPEARRYVAKRACIISLSLLLFFAFAGGKLIDLMRISPEAFRITGGLLLLLAAIDMVIGKGSSPKEPASGTSCPLHQKDDICVFPLSIPLLAGPGALTLTVLLMNEASAIGMYASIGVVATVLAVMLITLTSLLLGDRLMQILGMTGTNVLTRVFGIILCAVSIDNIIKGIVSVIKIAHA